MSIGEDAAGQLVDAALIGATFEKGGHGKRSKLPGGITKKQLMIGGAVVGGLALVLVLTNKKKA